MSQPKKEKESQESKEGKVKLYPYGLKLDGIHSKSSFKKIKRHEPNSYKVIKIINPGEFYLEHIPAPGSSPYTSLDEIYKSMQDFYNIETHQHAYRLRSSIAPQDRVYVCRSPSKDEWHRIRMITSCVPTIGNAKAFSLENFINVEVNFEDLLELNPNFYSLSKWAIKCHLAGLKPPHGLSQWPAESTDTFTRKCDGQILTGIASTRKIFVYGPPDNYKHPQLNLGIVLLPKHGSTTIQRELLDYGYADKIKKVSYDDEYSLLYEYAQEAWDEWY